MLDIPLRRLIHAFVSLAAVVLGVVFFVRQGAISPRSAAGIAYIGSTAASCVTALSIIFHYA